MLAMSLGLKMFGKELDKPLQRVYWQALADLEDGEFERACAQVLRTDSEFPTPARILAVARPPLSEAAVLRVMNGAWWDGRTAGYDGVGWEESTIRTLYGEAAALAFRACGGSAGFRAMDDTFRGERIRAAFVEAYRAALARDPLAALPAGAQRAAVLGLLKS